ncbi:MAG: hypothetical protein ABFC80_02635 [Coriobacteriales bacterium]
MATSAQGEYGHDEAVEDLVALHAGWEHDPSAGDCPAERLLVYIEELENSVRHWKRKAESEFCDGWDVVRSDDGCHQPC